MTTENPFVNIPGQGERKPGPVYDTAEALRDVRSYKDLEPALAEHDMALSPELETLVRDFVFNPDSQLQSTDFDNIGLEGLGDAVVHMKAAAMNSETTFTEKLSEE